jgi:hypothetical protein
MEIWIVARDGRDPPRLIHHSDRGIHCVSVRYTPRLADTDTDTAEHIDWFTMRRLHGELRMIPAIERGSAFDCTTPLPVKAESVHQSL